MANEALQVEADEIVQKFHSLPLVPFACALGSLPPQQGVYAIYANGKCLHVGESITKTVLGRFASHLAGGGRGAGGDLVQKAQDRGFATNVPEALAWIQSNCLVKGLAVEDKVTRRRVAVLLTQQLKPIWLGIA